MDRENRGVDHRTRGPTGIRGKDVDDGFWNVGEDINSCPSDTTDYSLPPPDTVDAVDTGPYTIAAYVMPGLSPSREASPPPPAVEYSPLRFKSIWDLVLDNEPWVPNADQPSVPLVGPYDEANPIAMDWSIKWALEHGVSLFIYDWFWHRGRNWFDDSRSLEQGLLQSKYLKNNTAMKLAVMWTNAYNAQYADDAHTVAHDDAPELDGNQMIGQAIEYFKHPNYFTIDGKPVFFIFRYDNLPVRSYVRIAVDGVLKATTQDPMTPSQLRVRQLVTGGDRDGSAALLVADPGETKCLELSLGTADQGAGAYSVDKIVMSHPPGQAYPNYQVMVSSDQRKWTPVVSLESYVVGGAGDTEQTYLLDEISAFKEEPSRKWVRYLRSCVTAEATERAILGWREIEVWGNRAGEYANLARDLFLREQQEIRWTFGNWDERAKASGLEGI